MIIIFVLCAAYIIWRLFVDSVKIVLLIIAWLSMYFGLIHYFPTSTETAFVFNLANNQVHINYTTVIPTIICFLILFSSRKNRHD